MIQFTQKTFTTRKEVFIENNSLLIKTKNVKENLEFKIKFEELGFDIVKKRVKTANIPFFAFLIFDLFFMGLLISSVISHEAFSQQLFWLFGLLLFSILTITTYFSRNEDVIYLTGGKKVLELLAAIPSQEAVDTFIENIHDAMKNNFKEKFSKFDSDTPYEIKVNQLKWLKEIKALTDEECTKLLNDIKTNNIIGFQRPE